MVAEEDSMPSETQVSSREQAELDRGDMPLSGVRVLDVTQVMAGPFCSMLLGDMGADVIKVEPIGSGDQTRGAMGFKLKGKDSLGFINMNRNKRSAAINLKSEAGRLAFYSLVKTADILVENYRPGAAARTAVLRVRSARWPARRSRP